MIRYEFGSVKSENVLIQMVDEHDLEVIRDEERAIQEMAGENFMLTAIKVNRWNQDLSPWNAPAVFGNEDFGDGAEHTLAEIMELTKDRSKHYYIGGYSLAGLFALWAVYRTDIFFGAAAASPSIWFPGFLDYMKQHEIQTERVYLSLGDREEKVHNPVMATVGNCIQTAYNLLMDQGISCILEWNQGNHFKEPEIRTAKGFAWLLS